MCGIAGYVAADGALGIDLEAMTRTLLHRGPDGSATWVAANRRVGLGHTRLSIIDLEAGAQPMHSIDGLYTITFNGEIYNYRALRAELEIAGATFRTCSDTEVLIEVVRHWGEDGLLRLHGMFALALFDHSTGELLLARDRTGIKPLYWAPCRGGLVFASELKGLAVVPGIGRRLDRDALGAFLAFSYPTLPRTGLQDCNELEPGTWMRVGPEGRSVGRYWRWASEPETAMTLESSVERARVAVTESIEDHLVADVPVAAFLSGGVDSSIVAAVTSRELGRPIDCFTVGFEDGDFDESGKAAAVAKTLGCPHHVVMVGSARGDVELANRVIDQFDTPFGDSSAIPTWIVSQAIRRHVKVALSGDGGDECFGGYPRFRWASAARRIGRVRPILRWAEVTEPYWPLPPRLVRAGRRMVAAAQAADGSRLDMLSAYHRPDQLSMVLRPEVLPDRVPSLDRHGAIRDAGAADFMDLTLSTVLPGDYLRKVDIASSAHGLEVRPALLGVQVLACAARIPAHVKVSGGTLKAPLRRLLARYLPASVTDGPKVGFTIPLDDWLGEAGRRHVGTEIQASAALDALIQPEYRRDIVTGFVTGRWDRRRYSRFMIGQRFFHLWALHRWVTRWSPSF